MEHGRRSKPLFTDIESRDGELNSSINRAEGLGGTNYWHNALIELTSSDPPEGGAEQRLRSNPFTARRGSLFPERP